MLWLVIALIVLALLLYLNRAYAYFFDYLDSHKVMPLGTKINFSFKNQNPNSKTTLSYVALGDSVTRGVGVDKDEQTYPYLVARFLSQKQDVELVNLGIPGAKTDEVIKLELPKLDQLKPDLISLMIGINDSQSIQTDNAFRKNYQIILERLTSNPQTKVLVLNIPYITNRKILLLPFKNLIDLRVNHFNSIIDNLVSEKKKSFKNLILVNLYDQTKPQFTQDPELYSEDLFHPSAKGYKLWSEIISANLNQ